MKQFGIGLLLLVGGAAFGAYFLMPNTLKSAVADKGIAQSSSIPRGTGFDFYVLSLSWSPTYCQDPNARKRDAVQCAGPRPFAFVVHGLWPQFERGYPRACRTNQTRPSMSQARAMLDVMPSERLVQYQWETHGTCSGLSGPDYLEVTRAAAKAVIVPDAYASAPDWRRVQAGEVEAAFTAANTGMNARGIAVTKRGNNLAEVRVCLTLDLKPRACEEVDQDGVSAGTRLSLPPSR